MPRRWIFALTALLGSPLVALGDFTTTFENTGLAANSSNNNAGSAGAFAIDGNRFNNNYDPTYGTFAGWALSSTTNTTDPTYANQYSSITGGGAGGSSTYAVGFTYGAGASSQVGQPATNPGYAASNPFHPSDTTITLAAGMSARSIAITNTTYSYLAMKNGDPYGFVPAFRQGDYELLDIRGYDAAGRQVGTVNFYLADYRGTSRTLVDTWQTVDLTALAGATTLRFGLQSSQNDPTYGTNIPAYFAADNFVFGATPAVVPEPSSLALVGIGLAIGGAIARRRRAA